MTGRVPALAAAAAIALVLAQIAFPATALYHTWQYAFGLVLALIPILAAGARAARRRTRDGAIALAMLGAAVVGVDGLAAGLLGPDTATVVGTPGTVVPIPSLGVAAAFPAADAGAIAAGRAQVTLRRRTAADVVVGGAPRPLGESLLYLVPRPAAYVDAAAGGAHLTVTQPTGAAFLSPVLLFRDRQRLGDVTVPLDTFATPSRARVFRALYFTPAMLAAFRHEPAPLRDPALVISAAGDDGKPLGIALAPSGQRVAVAGVDVTATLGSYPALAVAAEPDPWALGAGLLLCAAGVAGAAFSAGRRRPR